MAFFIKLNADVGVFNAAAAVKNTKRRFFGSSRISGKFDISKQIRYFTKPPPVPLLEKGEAIRHLTSAPPPCMSEGPTNSVKVVAFFCQGHYGS